MRTGVRTCTGLLPVSAHRPPLRRLRRRRQARRFASRLAAAQLAGGQLAATQIAWTRVRRRIQRPWR